MHRRSFASEGIFARGANPEGARKRMRNAEAWVSTLHERRRNREGRAPSRPQRNVRACRCRALHRGAGHRGRHGFPVGRMGEGRRVGCVRRTRGRAPGRGDSFCRLHGAGRREVPPYCRGRGDVARAHGARGRHVRGDRRRSGSRPLDGREDARGGASPARDGGGGRARVHGAGRVAGAAGGGRLVARLRLGNRAEGRGGLAPRAGREEKRARGAAPAARGRVRTRRAAGPAQQARHARHAPHQRRI